MKQMSISKELTKRQTMAFNSFISQLPRICHEVNRAYCKAMGDNSHASWSEAPFWQRESAVEGVAYHMKHHESTPKDSHENWLAEKTRTGWIYGPEKDTLNRLHPCMLPFDQLPKEQQAKDFIFHAIIKVMLEIHIENNRD